MAWYWILLIVIGSLFLLSILVFIFSAFKLTKLEEKADKEYYKESKKKEINNGQ